MFIGNVEIKGYAALAPMAGVADRAMRELCSNFGASYTVGELASAKGIYLGDKKSGELLGASDAERPFAPQLFGCEPQIMAHAAEIAMRYNPNMIDINMGCPAPKVAISSKGGSALLKNPQLAEEVVRAVVEAVSVPITVKIRSGWDENTKNAIEIAKRCEQAGASAITVHGRTRSQMYAPPVDIDIIKSVKESVKIPVIGNGDISCGADAARMYEYTGCDFVMVGRGAMGSPWVFAQINSWLRSETALPDPPLSEKLLILIKQVELMAKYKGENQAFREARKHAAWYMKGLRGAADLRRMCGTIVSMDDIYALCKEAMIKNK